MKKYIAAIVISCFLLQICGCYSYKVITIEELKNFKGPNEIKIKSHNQNILIERRSDLLDPMEWESNDSLIIIQTKEQVKTDQYKKLVARTSTIKLSEIEIAEIAEFDILKTTLLILTMGAIIVAGIAGSQLSGGIGMSSK